MKRRITFVIVEYSRYTLVHGYDLHTTLTRKMLRYLNDDLVVIVSS